MTPEQWSEMERNDYAPNPVDQKTEFAFGVGLFIAGCALGSLALWGLWQAAHWLAGVL